MSSHTSAQSLQYPNFNLAAFGYDVNALLAQTSEQQHDATTGNSELDKIVRMLTLTPWDGTYSLSESPDMAWPDVSLEDYTSDDASQDETDPEVDELLEGLVLSEDDTQYGDEEEDEGREACTYPGRDLSNVTLIPEDEIMSAAPEVREVMEFTNRYRMGEFDSPILLAADDANLGDLEDMELDIVVGDYTSLPGFPP